MISSCKSDGTIERRKRYAKGGSYVYVVYDEYDNGCVVTFGSTLEELALFLRSNVNTVKKMVYQGYCLHGRYVAEKVYT